MVSLDCETSGVDLYRGAKPFFVTSCNEQGDIKYWEWDVDPITRQPNIPSQDLVDIRKLVDDADELALHNAKFDITALKAINAVDIWPWDRTYNTLRAGHLLASNQPHDLTSMVLVYLGVNIKPYEDKLELAVKECRSYCRSNLPHWRIAHKDLPEMPSAGGTKLWRNDYWLPRALAKELELPEEHEWWSVLREYANVDSACTLPLCKEVHRLIKERNLWNIYIAMLKPDRVGYLMEQRGLTVNKPNLEELRKEYKHEAQRCHRVCVNIAKSYNYELELPKGAVNNSLRHFCFDTLKLEPIYNSKAKTNNPCLDSKNAIPHYLVTLPRNSKAYTFVKTLADKRKRDTAVSYLNSYERYWIPIDEAWIPAWKGSIDKVTGAGWYVLHPNLNSTGTSTLRWSSSNPNEQNISKKEEECEKCEGEGCGICNYKGKTFRSLRYCFGPAPGREWWSKDGKNLELRIPAYECKEVELIALFERPDEPPYYGSEHLLNFSTIYPDIWDKELKVVGIDKVGPHCKKKYKDSWYQNCKNGGFAVQYGAIERKDRMGTADKAFGKLGCHALLKSRFARKEALNQRLIAYANKHGYVETLPDKTVDPDRGYPLLCTRSYYGDITPTVPLSFHIQGTAMWWTTMAMVRVQEFFDHLNNGERFEGKRWPGGYHLALQVHDELVSDMPSGKGKGVNPYDYNLPIAKHVRYLMEKGGDDIGVPIAVGMEYHEYTWDKGVTI